MEKFKCSKCGWEDILINYMEKDTSWAGSNNTLICKCSRCGYKWMEVPLDEREDDANQR